MNSRSNLNKFYKGVPLSQHLQEFSAYFAICFVIIADIWIFIYGVDILSSIILLSTAVIFLIAFSRPWFLLPFWHLWLKSLDFLSRIIFSVILGILWMVLLFPVSIFFKMTKRKLMKVEFDENIKSYWVPVDKKKNSSKSMLKGS